MFKVFFSPVPEDKTAETNIFRHTVAGECCFKSFLKMQLLMHLKHLQTSWNFRNPSRLKYTWRSSYSEHLNTGWTKNENIELEECETFLSNKFSVSCKAGFGKNLRINYVRHCKCCYQWFCQNARSLGENSSAFKYS